MNINCRFAIISDLHIALPETIWDSPKRFHLVEISIPALNSALEHLVELDLDFLLLAGDLTQHGELVNHQWLVQRLSSLPFPVFVVPGNHDVPTLMSTKSTIGLQDFACCYEGFGYDNSQQLYYSRELVPGVQLIGLNSNRFDEEGKQLGSLDREQLTWLESILPQLQERLVLVMIHHNVIEHLPGQSRHELGKRYMLDNAPVLLKILQKYGVKLILTGHLHVQDIVDAEGVYEITTGSLVSYPHPYRVLQLQRDSSQGKTKLEIESYRIKSVAGWDNLAQISREWMGDRSLGFMLRLLTAPPFNLSLERATQLAPQLRYFWADIAAGDSLFDFPDFPPAARLHLQRFGAVTAEGKPNLIDNKATLAF